MALKGKKVICYLVLRHSSVLLMLKSCPLFGVARSLDLLHSVQSAVRGRDDPGAPVRAHDEGAAAEVRTLVADGRVRVAVLAGGGQPGGVDLDGGLVGQLAWFD